MNPMNEDPILLDALDEDGDLEDFILLKLLNKAERRSVPRFDFDSLCEKDCWDKFRFKRQDMPLLQELLGFPDRIVFPNRLVESGINTLAVLLRRLSYPNRWSDLFDLFGRPDDELSVIFNFALDHVYNNFGYLVNDLSRLWWLSADHLDTYSEAIMDKGAPLSNCWGFVDDTVRPISRPVRFQRVVFNGHHRVHALKFQSLTTANGLIANMWGPMEGRRHDVIMLRESNLLNQLENLPVSRINGQPFVIYGDPAYPVRNTICSPFRRGAQLLTPLQEEFNASMSSVRETVEWSFRDIITSWAFCDFKKNAKILLQPVAKYYIVASLLTNCRTCLYGNQTSRYFSVQPPNIEQYLTNTP